MGDMCEYCGVKGQPSSMSRDEGIRKDSVDLALRLWDGKLFIPASSGLLRVADDIYEYIRKGAVPVLPGSSGSSSQA